MKFQITLDTESTTSKVKSGVTNVKDKVSMTRQERKAIKVAKQTLKEQTDAQLLVLGTQLIKEQEAREAEEAAAKAAAKAAEISGSAPATA